MGLNSNVGGKKVSDLYLELSEAPKRFRPLAADTLSVWIHKINPVVVAGSDGKPRFLRKYSTEMCVSVGRSGAGCHPCLTQDPMWDKLDAKSKTNKKGMRTDFPKSCIDLLPVLDLDIGKVRVLKGGGQLYENMGQWLMSQPDAGKDLRRCEWTAVKTGKELYTKYSTVRLDATPFQMTPELEAEAAIVLAKAQADMAPSNREAFSILINGDNDPTNDGPNSATVSVPPSFSGAATGGVTVSSPEVTPQPVSQSVPQQPVVPVSFSFEPKVKPIPITPAAPQLNNAVETFSAWVNQQPEFQGMGAFDNLIPILQAQLGNVNFHACSVTQLDQLKVALSAKLDSVRTKRA